jgi:hypothetical protein
MLMTFCMNQKNAQKDPRMHTHPEVPVYISKRL